ncbi:MAG: tRNA uridine-5-carboxymethylaminomethyl(34) synthesis GTPase MnmE [Candidatus Eisenbacteria bacterium]|uniref:tRNA modification GTPase MnmE n=1 Tax=Eiseniibacteriota bacterium TaxID=2212470 RepID=A0A933W915_UNCEI|nr:tRNA uridine-5-carboxymethylaminomethyl(34) synthesis GTPase MnmE [Candidatus Eisenbacteria bacterium]
MSFALDDTIAAIATAPGEAGLAVVRVSGPEAIAVADRVFRGAAPLAAAAGNTLHHGWLAGTERVDEVVAALFRAPRSYTREDVVEFSCHGGSMPARSVLALLLASGARLARPGEFTLRAFLHGRLDLVQAEAVAELIGARSESMQRAALARLGGQLSRDLRGQLEALADALAEVEARVDFAEDVGGVEVPVELVARLAAIAEALRAHLRGAAWGRAMREGVPVVIVGQPNAGKSSLFNRLVGEDRAIVADVPGTTRDRVSATIEREGARFTLSDTAGLRETSDGIEALGIARAHEALEGSAVAIWVVDGSRALDAADHAIAARLAGRRVLVALHKGDRGVAVTETDARALLGSADGDGAVVVVRTSAVTGEGIEEALDALARVAGFEEGETLTVERQAHTLESACAALDRAAAAGSRGEPGEIVALELREALAALEELLGQRVSDDLLERVFSRFCIGK